ncbi:MAG: tRNA (adenosine(37)-N6)-dimethylallyltransferase MiaA [Paludibacteraceae bacterium]|nr:tRNA (adenosine(37)-N6)-dimethylallyltransferase MiaA [Paludibacteraceae bacterium]
MIDLIAIVGPTASGKTAFAAHLAHEIKSEIISADSRQIYRGMDLGTGKDIDDYTIDGQTVPYHLIDIADAGYKYNLFEYQRDFNNAYKEIKSRGITPIVCGGTGLYVESVLRGYTLLSVPENKELRERLADKSLEELTEILKQYKTLHNTTDVDTAKRAIRAIEIQEYYSLHPDEVEEHTTPRLNALVIGVDIEREERRNRISSRLRARVESGMVDEVKRLLDSGIAPEYLIYYGLEYKYLTNYVIGNLEYEEMLSQLEIAIHQFAKRQMTWFRGMEKRGTKIEWIDYKLPMNKKVERAKELIKEYNK